MQMPVWREVFLEVGLRAIKKVHLSHTPWQLKKHDIDKSNLKLLNEGNGIFLALETTIASEISNEFIYSSFTNGMNIGDRDNDIKPYSRYYEILREVSFKDSDAKIFHSKTSFRDKTAVDQKSNVVDLITRRWEYVEGAIKNKPAALIELKRYNTYDYEISTGIVKRKPGTNVEEIKRDIENLKILYKNWDSVINASDIKFASEEENTKPFLYILTWGEVASGSNIKESLANEIGILVDKITLKWLPLQFEESNSDTSPTVNNWLWLALIEIDQPDL